MWDWSAEFSSHISSWVLSHVEVIGNLKFVTSWIQSCGIYFCPLKWESTTLVFFRINQICYLILFLEMFDYRFCCWTVKLFFCSTSIIPFDLGILPAHGRTESQSGVLTHSRSSSKGSVEEIASQPKHKDLAGNLRQKMLLDYNIYMAKCVPQEKKSPPGSPVLSADSSPTAVKKVKLFPQSCFEGGVVFYLVNYFI